MWDYTLKEWGKGVIFISLFAQKAILRSCLLTNIEHYNHVLEKNHSSTKTNLIFTAHQKFLWNGKMTKFCKGLTETQRPTDTTSPSLSYPYKCACPPTLWSSFEAVYIERLEDAQTKWWVGLHMCHKQVLQDQGRTGLKILIWSKSHAKHWQISTHFYFK